MKVRTKILICVISGLVLFVGGFLLGRFLKNKNFESSDTTIERMKDTISSLKSDYNKALEDMEAMKNSQDESIAKCDSLEATRVNLENKMSNINELANQQSDSIKGMSSTLSDMNSSSDDILVLLSKIKSNNQLLREYIEHISSTNESIREESSNE